MNSLDRVKARHHLLWFRNDLRIHDHEALARLAMERDPAATLLCIWISENRRTGLFREKFLQESLADLDRSLQDLGQKLCVVEGGAGPTASAEVIEKLVRNFDITDVWFQNEHTSEELAVECDIERRLGAMIKVHRFEGLTLIKPSELTFGLEKLPKIFTEFRKKVEAAWPNIEVWPAPLRLPSPPPNLPTVNAISPRTVAEKSSPFRGGESEGMKRVQKYFWEEDRLKIYKETRNGLLDFNDSSKFSPWLSTGSLSARYIYREVARYEEARIKNESTYWMTFELLWRDYFRFLAIQQGPLFFTGPRKASYESNHDESTFENWKSGQTAEPFINANMRELFLTGYMSNRGRQNVASYLTRVLKCDWRKGADYFERMLVDYDAASNWGNWSYFSGTGNDPRDRSFNVSRQAEVYDPNGDYVRHWLGRSQSTSIADRTRGPAGDGSSQ